MGTVVHAHDSPCVREAEIGRSWGSLTSQCSHQWDLSKTISKKHNVCIRYLTSQPLTFTRGTYMHIYTCTRTGTHTHAHTKPVKITEYGRLMVPNSAQSILLQIEYSPTFLLLPHGNYSTCSSVARSPKDILSGPLWRRFASPRVGMAVGRIGFSLQSTFLTQYSVL